MCAYYHDPCTNCNIYLDDPYASLTAQTLDAWGNPKRPMNAFLIFSRIRRPQIAAQNLCMGTGEISKILGHEWKTMAPAGKSFYQNQAKQLRANFKIKHPDYIYTRSPNHTRRRRKSGAPAPQPRCEDSEHCLRVPGDTSPAPDPLPPCYWDAQVPLHESKSTASPRGAPYGGPTRRHRARAASYTYFPAYGSESAHIAIPSLLNPMTAYESSALGVSSQAQLGRRRSESCLDMLLTPLSQKIPAPSYSNSASIAGTSRSSSPQFSGFTASEAGRWDYCGAGF